MSASTRKTIRFGGWSEFIRTISQPKRVAGAASDDRSVQDWTWTANYDEAMGLAMTGWAEGFKEISVKADAIGRRLAGDEMCARLAEAGDEVDVGLVLAGEPECMVEYPIEPRRRPVVRFVVSVSAASGIPALDIYNRGAAVLAAVDTLEAMGVRCEVELDWSVRSRKLYTWRVPLKGAGDAVDRDKLAFAMCHPSTLRRLCFRLAELDPKADAAELVDNCYGMPSDPAAEEGAVILGCVRWSEWGTDEITEEYAKGLVEKALGVVK